MAGYSTTPLWKKLGYKPGIVAYVHQAPAGYRTMLDLPAAIAVGWLNKPEPGLTFAHVFVREYAELKVRLTQLRHLLAPDGTLWISWPKKASKVATDITEDRIREAALPLGWVDIKVCAVDEIWSGLRLAIRRELRPSGRRTG